MREFDLKELTFLSVSLVFSSGSCLALESGSMQSPWWSLVSWLQKLETNHASIPRHWQCCFGKNYMNISWNIFETIFRYRLALLCSKVVRRLSGKLLFGLWIVVPTYSLHHLNFSHCNFQRLQTQVDQFLCKICKKTDKIVKT